MTYISWFSDFALPLEGYLMDEYHTLRQCNTKIDFLINVGHSDLYFMVL